MPYQPTQNYYYQPPTTQPRQNLLGLKGRPVTGLEEVRAAAIDFDGTISFFPDLANGKIYTKQCNADGTASLHMYEIKELPTSSEVNSSTYVTRDEFNQTMSALKQVLAQANLVTESPDQTQPQQTSTPEFNF